MLLTCSAPLAPIGSTTANFDSQTSMQKQVVSAQTRPTLVTQPEIVGNSGDPTPSMIPIVPTITPGATAIALTISPTSDQITRSLDRYMNDLASNGQFSGAILIATNDQPIFVKGYGPADRVGQVANTYQTRFRLASLTKQFTAMGIMILQSQGRLTVSDPICNYLDDCPAAWKPVQIRHLLNHTSGIVDYTDYLSYEETEGQPATPQQLVARFRDQPLSSTPGELYDYCNSGYVLLGLIIERTSGMSYADFIRKAIFEPLGMQNSGFDASDTFDPSLAFPYFSNGQPASFLNATTLFSAGALYSTVEDLYRWDQALSTEQLIPRALLDEIFTPGNGSYGYGWKIERPAGKLRISHAGNMTGVSNFNVRYPEQQLTIIVLSNMETTNAAGISDYIASMIIGG